MILFEIEADGVTAVRAQCARCQDGTTTTVADLRHRVPNAWCMTLEEIGGLLACPSCRRRGISLFASIPAKASGEPTV